MISGSIFLALIVTLYFFIRWRIRSNLDVEFSRFNQFLHEIELLTEQIHHIYNEEDAITINTGVTYHAEQTIINKAISRLFDEIRRANKSLCEAISVAEQKRFQEELTATALQVVHDIGSALSVLEMIVQSASLALPEDSRVGIRNAAQKMRDIANSLLKKAKRDFFSLDDSSLTRQPLYSVINQVVSEKRLQYCSHDNLNIYFDVHESSFGLFAIINVVEFSRVLSNVINNAVESIAVKNGEIAVSLLSDSDSIILQIEDNGIGMSRDLIDKIGQFGVTHGKINGNGLGLFHAKTTIENWGGKLEIQSEIECGTTVIIYLPKTQPPAWFAPRLEIQQGQTVVVIDDDESIHAVWRERFKCYQESVGQAISLLHFYSPDQLIVWKETEDLTGRNVLYLCDHEFVGSNENGIDLITTLGINYLSILVTNRFYTDDVIIACEAANIKLLPKNMARIVPVISV